jgi:hypothetical protein
MNGTAISATCGAAVKKTPFKAAQARKSMMQTVAIALHI